MRKIVEAPPQSVVSIARSFHHFRLHLGIFRAGTTYLPRMFVGFPISARNITAIAFWTQSWTHLPSVRYYVPTKSSALGFYGPGAFRLGT